MTMPIQKRPGPALRHSGRIEYVGGLAPFKPVCDCGTRLGSYVTRARAEIEMDVHLDGLDLLLSNRLRDARRGAGPSRE